MTRWTRTVTRGVTRYSAVIAGVECTVTSREGGVFWDGRVRSPKCRGKMTYAKAGFAKTACERVAKAVGT